MSIKREVIKVYDMTCKSCENKVERELRKLKGVQNVIASFTAQQVTVEYDIEFCNKEQLKGAIKKAGYSTENSQVIKYVGFFIVVAAILILGNSTSGFDMSEKLNGASYFVLFVVGMLTSIHCVGMCGGIMLTQSSYNESKSKLESIIPGILYNAGRITSYTIIGGLVGALGSVFSLSLGVKAGLQMSAGIFMIIMGLNMAGFTMFRKFNIKLPWSSCSVKNKPKTPFLVGLLNGLMPCGPLQTMQLYALGTGSALSGALSMFLFSLGTVPLMLLFGAISGFLSKGYTKQLLKFSGFLIIILGIIMGSRGLALAGVGFPNMNSLNQSANSSSSDKAAEAKTPNVTIENGVQVIRMTADNRGYTPNVLYVKKNMPVKWIVEGKQLTSCNNAIAVSSLNIQKTLKAGENVIEFTPGDKDINFSCWMGMIRGVIKVTDNIEAVDTSKVDESLAQASSDLGCCAPGGTSATQGPSIYGDDLSKVATDRLVKKASVSGNTQSLNIKGIGYEFEPIILVLEKSKNAKLTIDLNNFDNTESDFELINADSGETVSTFKGKKGVITVDVKVAESGTYLIIQEDSIAAGVEVVDELKAANLEDIRTKYLGQ